MKQLRAFLTVFGKIALEVELVESAIRLIRRGHNVAGELP
jgi:hypothetical protein